MYNNKPGTKARGCTPSILVAVAGIALCLVVLLGFITTQALQVNLTNDELDVRLQEKILCPAQSEVGFDNDEFTITADIPGNVAITKIYASIQEAGVPQIDNGTVTIRLNSGDFIFAIDFPKDPNSPAGFYETTFVQPLCVDESGAVARLTSLVGNEVTNANRLLLTIVYCPDYCIE